MTAQPSNGIRATRRDFIKAAVIGPACAAALTGCRDVKAPLIGPGKRSLVRSSNVIVFQGDSITDAGRDRGRESSPNDGAALGKGYAFLAACQLLARRPADKLKIYNRGISGNKVFQLAERWDKDCLSLKPDLLSILIGVNDIWHKLNGNYDGTVQKYEKDYDALLEWTRRELPDVRLVICEPFVLRCGAVNDKWFPEFDAFRAAARRIAGKFGAAFVTFQNMFDEAVKKAPPAYWAGDGVHPTNAGAALMANRWLEAVA